MGVTVNVRNCTQKVITVGIYDAPAGAAKVFADIPVEGDNGGNLPGPGQYVVAVWTDPSTLFPNNVAPLSAHAEFEDGRLYSVVVNNGSIDIT